MTTDPQQQIEWSDALAQNHRPQTKDDRQYDRLLAQGMYKAKAPQIAPPNH